ncbi:MAG TPA: hypothetical protein VH540_04570 [Ktedonobacterales bacterium]|jgi:hypothetical protein
MEDDPRTFRVSGPLPPLEELPSALAPLPQNPPASIPNARKQFLWGLVPGMFPLLLAFVGASSGDFFFGLAALDLFINIILGAGLASIRANRWSGFVLLIGSLRVNRWFGFGLLIGSLLCVPTFCVLALALDL